MAPTKPKKLPPTRPVSRACEDEDEDEEASQSQGTSQVISTEAIHACVRKRDEQARAVRAQREREIESDRKQRIANVQKKMGERRRAHEASLRARRQPTVDRLRALLAEKRELERQLNRCYQRIDRVQEATIQQVQVALQSRLQDIKK